MATHFDLRQGLAQLAARRFAPSLLYPEDHDWTPSPWHERGHVFTAVGIPEDGFTCRYCGSKYVAAQVIAIDGGCRDSRGPKARSAIGIFFANGSPYNMSEVLDVTPHTKQIAQLRACKFALEMVLDLKREGRWFKGFRYVIIKADSGYLVKGMTELVFNWKVNGWKNVKGKPLRNAMLFHRIDQLVHQLERKWALKVLFWHVPREQNREADALVNAALDAA